MGESQRRRWQRGDINFINFSFTAFAPVPDLASCSPCRLHPAVFVLQLPPDGRRASSARVHQQRLYLLGHRRGDELQLGLFKLISHDVCTAITNQPSVPDHSWNDGRSDANHRHLQWNPLLVRVSVICQDRSHCLGHGATISTLRDENLMLFNPEVVREHSRQPQNVSTPSMNLK